MHCTHCHYALWNLATRTCPECGTAFTIRNYATPAADVRFRCAHCGDTSPWPAGSRDRGRCASCNADNDLDAVAAIPSHHRVRCRLLGEINPWFIGLPLAFTDTIGMVFEKPQSLMRGTRADASLARSAGFAALNVLIFMLVVQIPVLMLAALFANAWFAGLALGVLVASLAAGCLIPVLAVVAHLSVNAIGSLSIALRATLHAAFYSTGTAVLAIFPVLGPPLALCYAVAILPALLAGAHRVPIGPFAAAVYIPAALALIALIGIAMGP